ncbi:MAG: tyrosine-type recombinase/integrase [Nitrospirae bacterium]|nr:tyrosine-type recombinase/integrase [Nitrospirota bacterium]MDE3040958.1 tyrosine-type recombinase/integrase [Nitrospirota bacterium]MDE3051019.1 tyrosine-type recombinase/integrase [Nitrospirota bacterium]MDE3220439.1 tyrosine-type recombinase/integrase [Nitrospirota bacterium]
MVAGGPDATHTHDPGAEEWRTGHLAVQCHGGSDLAGSRRGTGEQCHYVFVNEAGHRRNGRNLLRSFYPAMRKAGIARFRFHDLRHTFATRLIQAGINVYTVQKLGRWKMISMVLRYAHHQPEEFARGAEVLDRLRRESIVNVAQSGLARAAELIDTWCARLESNQRPSA